MKKFFQYFIIILLFAFWGIILQNKTAVRGTVQEITGLGLPCAKPFEYSIGAVDSRFEIDSAKFLAVAQEAEKIWEDQSGKDLFAYNPSAEFKINLIFDERQAQSNEADKLEEDLQKLEASHNKITGQYESLSGNYAQKMARYNSDVATYEKKLKNYDEDVEDWNKSDRTDEDDYEKLQKEKKELNDLRKKLEQERTEINQLAGKTNKLVSQENNVVSEYNANVSTYKNKYGGGREFEKGVYDGKEINLYQFKEDADLRMTLIHEMGHSLGIGHLENTQSIMYYLLSEQDLNSPKLSEEDLNALKTVCKFK
ncbi:MAG TPA: hypothetical protein DCS28_01115 [Candidatus Moranbacteria bacterium]|nr:hypothetical protein [Candidatus Moranbacteria bacterium]HAT74629.1 hypothetical protein [Candidatus Moranbacteria bacterium]